MQVSIVFSAGRRNVISNHLRHFIQWFCKRSILCLCFIKAICHLKFPKHLFCQFQWAGTLCSVLAHSCIPWTLGDFPSAVTWCWWSNGRDDPVETGVVPPWIFPICCVQGVEHYLVVPLSRNGIKQTLWPMIGISREIKEGKPRIKGGWKVLNEHRSLKLLFMTNRDQRNSKTNSQQPYLPIKGALCSFWPLVAL